MCYGDIDHGSDGYYRQWMEDAAEIERQRQQWEEQIDMDMQPAEQEFF